MELLLKILITGGSGFIGTNFVNCALSRNHKIYNIDNLSLFSKDHNTSHKNYTFSKIDIRNETEILEILNKFVPDKIINMAAESHVDKSISEPKTFLETNILGTYNILEAANTFWKNTKNASFCFHHVSTDEVFGSLKKYDEPFIEYSNYKPNSPYSASKAGSDHLVRSWNKTFGLPISITHCSNNFGPYQSPEKLIPLTIIKCLTKKNIPVYGNGKNVRDWIYVLDHVSALLDIMENNVINQNFVIGSRNEKTNIQIINQICNICYTHSKKKYNYKLLINYVEDRLGHDYRYAINNQKIINELGWKPEYNFHKGLNETIDWYIKKFNT